LNVLDQKNLCGLLSEYLNKNPGLTYRDVALRAGIASETVWRWLNDKSSPEPRSALALLYGMGISGLATIDMMKKYFPDHEPKKSTSSYEKVDEDLMQLFCESVPNYKFYALTSMHNGVSSELLTREINTDNYNYLLAQVEAKELAEVKSGKVKTQPLQTYNHKTNLKMVKVIGELAIERHNQQRYSTCATASNAYNDEGVKDLKGLIKKFKKDLDKLESDPTKRGNVVYSVGLVMTEV
jgi:transcriptional regulator with XRE-family HTH domain